MKGGKKSPSSSTYLRGNSYSNRELPKKSGGHHKPSEDLYGDDKDENQDQRLNNARIRALENMKNHEGVYIEYLENLSGKKEAREEELRREKEKIDDLIEKNSKVVLKLVGSYFEELKEQWLNNYHQVIQDKMIGGISTKIKKIRQKLSKIRKISESFVSGNYEEDLLNYGLEKDLTETQSRLDESLEEIEMVDKTHLSNVSISLKKEKIRDFFFALQELVEFHFESPSIAKAPEISPVPARREFKQSDWSGHPNLLENTKREVLRAKELHNDDDNLLNDSNFMDDICLKKFGETKQPPKHDTLDKKQGSNKKKGGSRHKSPDSVNKENRFDNSKLSSNEVFDISQNSVSDLLGTKLGVTKLKLQKETSPVNPESSKGEFYLHFFQPRSNKLHLITQKGDNFVKETMELGEFIVPRYHKSLLTTEGVIILTGGFVDERPSKLSYLLDIDRNLMTEICEMNMGRTGHCILGHAGLIYVIGGVGEDGSTTETCEVFSPQLNTWSHIANLNFGCHSACAISINGSIVKFAGKSQEGEIIQAIERFNGREWLEVKFDRSKLRLFSSSIVFQINKHEVMIVGGTEEEYENKTSECFILSCKDLEKNNSVGVRKGPALPIREGFWSQEVEELNGSLYMLQNVAHQRDKNSVLLDQRRLLQFDAEAMEWNVLNVN